MNELSDCILQIDTREKAQSRIDSMQSFFESRGACVEFGAITINEGYTTSMDYALSGSYGKGTKSEREPADKPHCSRSADLHDISQSSSTEHSEKQPPQKVSEQHSGSYPAGNAPLDKLKLGTPDNSQSCSIQSSESHTESSSSSAVQGVDTHDTEGNFKDRLSELLPSGLQSSAGLSTHIPAVDPAEGTILRNLPIQSPKPSAGNFHEVRAKETIKSLEDAVVDYVYEQNLKVS